MPPSAISPEVNMKESPFSTFNSKASTATAKNKTMIPPTTERIDRSSFSSVKESHTSGIAQNFTDSKTSSYLRHFMSFEEGEEAIADDSSSTGVQTPEEKVRAVKGGLMTNPDSRLHGAVCPCDGFRWWKGISVKGRVASKSFTDLKGLGNRWDWETWGGDVMMSGTEGTAVEIKKGDFAPGTSPFESLPVELLVQIVDLLATDIPPNGFTARNIELVHLLRTSKAMHSATLHTLHSQITIPHSRIFAKFLAHIKEHPSLGTLVRRLDFSHFSFTGVGMSARERAETLHLIPATLLHCLQLTPNLQEFLAQEHIDEDLDHKVIEHLLCYLPNLKALDFTACSSDLFKNGFTKVIEDVALPDTLPITRLNLHECATLPSEIFTTLLPKLKNLTILDVAHTRITPEALESIPHTAKLTHLNLAKCTYLTAEAVIKFISTHPAAKTLLYFNLAMDAKLHELLSAADLTELIPHLPSTLRSLNLKGSKMDSTHIPLLLPLTKHLEELGLGRHLRLPNLLTLFLSKQEAEIEEQISWIPHTLRYIDISDLSVSEIDLGSILSTSCPLLKSITEPLEVMEVSPEVFKRLDGHSALKRAGWCMQEAGRRSWIVRVKNMEKERVDKGARSWKMGAMFWGMRKVPVARTEVGGLYGLYMFKR